MWPTASCKTVDGVNRRIGLHDVDHLAQDSIYRLKRSVLIGLNRTHYSAVILLREEAFGNVNIEVDVQPNRRKKLQHGDRREAQHAGQSPPVESDDGIEGALSDAVRPTMFFMLLQQ